MMRYHLPAWTISRLLPCVRAAEEPLAKTHTSPPNYIELYRTIVARPRPAENQRSSKASR